MTLRRLPATAEPSDGDKGDITVSNSGLTWTVDSGILARTTPVFEWNGVDTTQFADSDAFQSDSTSGALSVVADSNCPSGNKLRYAGTGTGAGAVVRLASGLLDDATNYLWELEVITITAQRAGIAFYADITGGAGHLYAYLASWGAACNGGIVNDGTLTINSGSTQNPLPTATVGMLRSELRGAKVAGGGGKFLLYTDGLFDTASGRGHSTIRQTDYGSPAAGYNALAARSWGLCLMAGGGSAFGTIDLQALRVYRL